MNDDALKATVLRLLGELAPEVDVSQLKPDVPLRDQVDLDSMDFLNFLIAIHEELQVDIPEADYGKLATLNALFEYLKSKLAAEPA